MPDPHPTLTLQEIDELEAEWRRLPPHEISYMGSRGVRFLNLLLPQAPDLLALARRAIRVEAVVEACIDAQEGGFECPLWPCEFYNGGHHTEKTPHDEACPLVTANLITRDGKRTEQK